jgi:hypothetical protein
MKKDTAFHRPYHDINNYTGTNRPAVSQASWASASAASAYVYQYGSAFCQNGRPDILIAQVPYIYAYIARSGNLALLEETNMWCVAQFRTNSAHGFAVGEKEFSAMFPTLIPTNR